MTLSRRTFVSTVLCSGAGVAYAAEKGGGGNAGSDSKPVFVVAEIEVKPGKRDEFVAIFTKNVPNVLAEDGCIFYEPVIDTVTDLAAQAPRRDNVMTVMEKWSSLDALRAHLQAPHMKTYGEAVKDLVAGVTIRVMESV
ncbi:MAG: antibiotic biosynthesis monooxygenase [Candidatus Hydrogenedentes bacterium]|nr:antibiotic biosynthesis monooxygenase [Candidatus Hydrogenedentota bacterium]